MFLAANRHDARNVAHVRDYHISNFRSLSFLFVNNTMSPQRSFEHMKFPFPSPSVFVCKTIYLQIFGSQGQVQNDVHFENMAQGLFCVIVLSFAYVE